MNSYLKSKLKNINIITMYYICIILLTIYATYKNGIVIYNKGLISFISIFKPLILVILAISITYLINYIFNKIKGNKYNILNDYKPIYLALITLTLPLNINIFLYLIIIIIFNIVILFYKGNYINNYALLKIVFILLLIIFNKYNYMNIYELSIERNLNTFDLILGRGIGGIATNNIILILICFLILFNAIHKKEIVFISFLSYLFTMLIGSVILHNVFSQEINNLITSEFIYAIVFIASMSHFTPLRYKEKIVYAITIGILSYIFNHLINNYDGVFYAIILANIVVILYKKLERVIIHGHK